MRRTASSYLGLVLLAGVALWFATTTSGATSGAGAQEVEPTTPSGAELYGLQCSACHGPAGGGVRDRGPSPLVEGQAATDFVLRTGRMPIADPYHEAQRGPVRFSEEEIVTLVEFVGSLGDGPAIPTVELNGADVVNGGELYRLNCAACHVASGSGAIIGGGRRAPSLMDAAPVKIAEAIIIGPGAMPVFGQFEPSEIADIAAYVGQLQDRGTTDADSLGGIGPVAEGLAAWLLALVPLIALTRWIGESRGHLSHETNAEHETRDRSES